MIDATWPAPGSRREQMAGNASIASASIPLGAQSRAVPIARARLENIDALRGFVMVLMLLDHLRETWFVYVPVADPLNAQTTLPALGFARFAVSFCAPIFVA